MNFKEWLISEEIYAQNNTATVYHRTCGGCNEDKSIKAVSSILTKDYKVGTGCLYGCGLYTTFAIESQFTNYMETYGKAVVKFKVTDLDKYLIFQLSVAKQIHGKDYKISDQLKKLGLLGKVYENLLQSSSQIYRKPIYQLYEIKLKEYDELQEKENYSSALAKEFYDENNWIVNSVKGIIYYGKNDGYCLVKYPTVQDGTITMLGYAVAEPNDTKKMEELKSNDGWIKSVGVLGTSIKNVYKSPIKNKERFEFGDNATILNQLLKSKNLEKTAKKLRSNLNKLSDGDVYNLILKSTDKKQEMAEVIAKYKTELTDWNVENLLDDATDKDKIAELIIQNEKNNISKLSKDSIYYLLQYQTKEDKIKIAQIINRYHTKKTPEIQKEIDKYLQPQTIASK